MINYARSRARIKTAHYFFILLIWVICLTYFFPILYMFITSLKHETDVIPPKLFFTPTLENYRAVLLSSDIVAHIVNRPSSRSPRWCCASSWECPPHTPSSSEN